MVLLPYLGNCSRQFKRYAGLGTAFLPSIADCFRTIKILLACSPYLTLVLLSIVGYAKLDEKLAVGGMGFEIWEEHSEINWLQRLTFSKKA